MIRRAVAADLPALREIYRDSVETLGPDAYTAAQTRAWADTAESDSLGAAVLGNETWIDSREGRIEGFCTMEQNGRVALLYVRGEQTRRGIGTGLLAHALEHTVLAETAVPHAEASEFSIGLFRRFGFRVVARERVTWNGAEFLRYRVRRDRE